MEYKRNATKPLKATALKATEYNWKATKPLKAMEYKRKATKPLKATEYNCKAT
jgi:hypothetical protein